jgi:hypothetical protein
VTLTTIQNRERGRTGLPGKRLAALANALHCQPIDLLMLPGTGMPRDVPPTPPGERPTGAALPREPAAD